MSKKINLFAKINKVEDQEDGTIKVMGYASSEAKDAQGETIKASAITDAIPEFMKFGTGNLREMHQPIAAGTVPFMKVLDDGRTEIHAHVVDSETVKKVKHGVLKGFSIGGSVSSRDDADKSIIKGVKLSEISLVDRPANPEARVTFWKIEEGKPAEVTPAVTPAVAAVNEIAEMLNSGFDPARLVDLAKADLAPKVEPAKPAEVAKTEPEAKPEDAAKKAADAAQDAEDALRKEGAALGLTSLHSLHLALAEDADEASKAELVGAMQAIGDEATKGDFAGHPFRGNQHAAGAGGSAAAVHASQRTKYVEKSGNKTGQRDAHKVARDAHKAASANSTGTTKAYHDKMASFHAVRASHSAKAEGTDNLSKSMTKAELIASLKKYAGEEISDATTAMNALSNLSYLLSKEMQEADEAPEQVQDLLDAIDKIKAFIVSEIQEDTSLERAAKPGDLKKVADKLHTAAHNGESVRLAKAIEGMASSVADLRKQLTAKDAKLDELTKMIGNMPTTPKGGEVFVVSKGGKVEDELIVKRADGSIDQDETFKKAYIKAQREAGLPV